MPNIHAHQLSFQLNSGEWLFHSLDFHFPAGKSGLVGRNGGGKSVLLQLLIGKLTATSGHVHVGATIGYFDQNIHEQERDATIATYLGMADPLAAFRAIEAGSVDTEHFTQLGEQWNIVETIQSILDELRITLPPDASCRELSGGQFTLLKLKRLFLASSDALVLDEPTNHLDTLSREWLITQLRKEQRPVLVASHDRALLMEMDRIARLTSEGLHWFEGNYAAYHSQWQLQQQALERKVAQLKSEQKSIARELQKSREKAQQRATQGRKALRTGSQPKILMDGKKNSAEKSRSAAVINGQNQLKRNQQQLLSLSAKRVRESPTAIYLADVESSKNRLLLSVERYRSCGANHPLLDFQVRQFEHLRLSGANGCGKSRLLKAIAGLHQEYQGQIKLNTSVVYLDQDYRLLNLERSVLENLVDFCPSLGEGDARLLLAGIGFRGDSVHRKARHLSGGEKMKLAMLMVSHVDGDPLLLLDEPDNHLDIESKTVLAAALRDYRGALILVSHDDYFVEAAKLDKECKVESLGQ
ncbi:ABC transporter ATP-binding protein [Vibrio navarrensis]|uniref:ABC-F family ATP-binding cassette domain-containing protein n=1 Tax=Vibrio navarrensis TaxID=29495 RepID=UPI00186A91DF|nr:ATP-binding cassette domain-containing protein [Vibrio navarrensis]MBE4577659.1 ABC transporter ATP-binding protein [Vibrio navarrensis]MBE4596569.1 ABC transporter ATP-binding protein [Vibrio navarrensis]MBE4599939.1 ABC transporter ATP-binding protein [Vibrio navarrensis]MBE4608243.1 ABC transporter ATP-binding protein [Vibrio navarrensis]MBE4611703.1 ABC transporter ATP-binding protein [Vibrio navarrensis]